MPTLNWIGKDKIINHHLEVPYKVLNHQYGFSEKGKTEAEVGLGNLIINGDNLEALKSLLPKYEGKVKCIYIDPPYNTGNEGWVYNDNVNSPQIQKWFAKVVGKESEDLTRHDKWLCMMYPRLKLLHKLLANDGAIFISIDDNEQANLKLMMDEIFGNGNFIGNLPRITKRAGKSADMISLNHDWLLIYKKGEKIKFNLSEHTDEGFKNSDEYIDERGKYKLNQTLDYGSIQYSVSLDYEIEIEGNVLRPGSVSKEEMIIRQSRNPKSDYCWRWSKDLYEFGLLNGFIVLKKGKNGYRIYTKTYQNATILKDSYSKQYKIEIRERSKSITTLDFIENIYSNDNSRKELVSIFDNKVFEYSKPSSLIEKIVQLTADKNSIILDSFAGSGTTAHAVLNLNKQDGGNRKFILIEMEDYAETITAERVKRVIKGYIPPTPKGGANDAGGTGGSFDYYTLGETLFNEDGNLNEIVDEEKIREYVWFAETKEVYQKQEESYLLGAKNGTAYYFFYEKDSLTALDETFLRKLKTKASQYVIYADVCLLNEKLMDKYHIVFKKIPRDISKL